MRIQKRFETTPAEVNRTLRTGGLTLILDASSLPSLELTTDGGLPCILRGEDIGRLTRWLTEPGYKA